MYSAISSNKTQGTLISYTAAVAVVLTDILLKPKSDVNAYQFR